MKHELLAVFVGVLTCAASCEKGDDEPITPEQEIAADTTATNKPLPTVDSVPIVKPDTLPTIDTLPTTDTAAAAVGLHLPIYTNPNCTAQNIRHLAYETCYNYEWYIPNWVAYILTKDELNAVVEREGAFVPDPEAKK